MKRILCADDDPGLQDVFPIIFGRAGYEVTMVSNGEQLMENEFETPDLFLLDKPFKMKLLLDLLKKYI